MVQPARKQVRCINYKKPCHQRTRERRTSVMGAARRHMGWQINRTSAPEGLQRISEANLKHGRKTKDKLAAQRHAAKVGRRVLGELKRIEGQLVDAVLMSDD